MTELVKKSPADLMTELTKEITNLKTRETDLNRYENELTAARNEHTKAVNRVSNLRAELDEALDEMSGKTDKRVRVS